MEGNAKVARELERIGIKIGGVPLVYRNRDIYSECSNGHQLVTLVYLNCVHPGSTEVYETCVERCCIDTLHYEEE